MNVNNKILDEIPQSAQTHLNMLQAIIQRMSTNSASCKTWCITLVSGLVVVLFTNSNNKLFPVIIVPVLLFFFLDAYYLALEKRFRMSHDLFIEKIHNGQLVTSDLFVIRPSGKMASTLGKSILSLSVWPFYVTLFLLNLGFYIYLIK